jgi:hypothetical protein
MAISDSQKVDYLWKKLGYSATKTDTNANKKAPNEAIASPLLMRGDTVWNQASSIPGVQPASSSSPVTVYPTSAPVECTMDVTATTNRTWKTGQADWISPEFGSTYQVKVYIHDSSDAANATTGDQVFATGTGNDDEWFFDYQSGVLHFIGSNLPNGVSFTGKSVYIAGSYYSGAKGVEAAGSNGDYVFTNNEMAVGSGDPIVMDNSAGLVLPAGTNAERDGSPVAGEIRWNTDNTQTEVYNGSSWVAVGAVNTITTNEFNGDNSTTAFTLSESTEEDALIVSINGTLQEAGVAYTVSGSTLTFAEAPLTGDRVQARNFFSGQSVNLTTSSIVDDDNDTKIQVEESSDEDTIRFDIAGTEKATMTAATTTVKNDLVVEGAIKSDTFYFVKRSTNTNITYPGSYGSVTIDYEDAGDDYGSTDAMWDSSTDRFTPTVAGLWYFRMSVDCYSGATQEGGVSILKNGSTIASSGHIGAIRPELSTHVYMNGTTDYIQFQAYTQSATTRGQSATNSFFEALLVKQAE